MKQQIGFISKIAIASLVVSELVKYGGRILPLQEHDLTALAIVISPSIILAIIFALRAKDSSKVDQH